MILYTFFSIFLFYTCSIRGISSFAVDLTLSISSTGNVITAGNEKVFEIGVRPALAVGPCSLSIVDADSTATMADIGLKVVDEQDTAVELTKVIGVVTSSTTVTISLSTVSDNDPSETLKLRLECARSGSTPIIQDINFRIDPPTNGEGDPHFLQTVIDKKTNIPYSICYDVKGESGQIIRIFTDSKLQLQVDGQLMDDYYMHKMTIKFRQYRFQITTRNILNNIMKMDSWDGVKREMWTELNDLVIKRNDNYLRIAQVGDDSLSLIVYRRQRSDGQLYLDISIAGLKTDYTGQDGLIGRIGSNQFHFEDPVQEEKLNTARSININGQVFKGKKENRSGRDCILINVREALYPHNLPDRKSVV